MQIARRLYNGIAKLQFNINQNHNLIIRYIAAPSALEGYNVTLSVYLDTNKFKQERQFHDVSAHYLGKLFQQKLQLDVFYGYHDQGEGLTPMVPQVSQITYLTSPADPYSLADFENIPECQRRTRTGAGSVFNPCPVTQYITGRRPYTLQTLRRHQLISAATCYLHAAGVHALKFGFEFEDINDDNTFASTGRDYDPSDPSSGHRLYQTTAEGSCCPSVPSWRTLAPRARSSR